VADMPSERMYERFCQRSPRSSENNASPAFDAVNEGDSLELSDSHLVQEN